MAEVPEVTAWLQLFQHDALRYPVLLLLGQSMSGKTEFANSLFKKPLELKIGPLLHFPDKLRSFDRKMHNGFGTTRMKCHGLKGQHDDSHFVNMHLAIALAYHKILSTLGLFFLECDLHRTKCPSSH